MIISIVGLSGSGKSFISKTLTSLNPKIIHLDIDKIGHSVYDNPTVLKNLIKTFGTTIIVDNKVNRKKLSQIVFNSPKEMKKLEEITWSCMEETIDAFIRENSDKIILLDWLLLPKTKYFKLSNYRILVTAPFETRLKRALERDNITEEQFITRDNAAPQINENEFDYIIKNEELEKTQKEVRLVYDKSIIHRKF